MTNKKLLKKFKEYDQTKPQKIKEIAGLLGIPINGMFQVEVPNRNGFVYVRLRNNTNELIQAFNEKVSPVYGLPVLVAFKNNRYEVQGRDTARYSDWGSFSTSMPKHGSQHSLNFENGQGGDVTWVYSRQMMPFATTPSGTEGAGTVFVMPHVYRNPVDASWNYIGDESSPSFLPAKPTGTSARMMLLYWDLDTSDPLIATGTFFSESLTGTSAVLPYIPTITNQRHIPLAGIRLVSGTETILWDNIYDMRQWATTTPSPFNGGFAVQDDGAPVGTGTTLNFVGSNVIASISGSVIQVFVTGSSGGGSQFAGVDQIGIFAQDEGVPIGTGKIINFVGNNVDVSRSGTVLRVFVTGSSGGGGGWTLIEEKSLSHTGTIQFSSIPSTYKQLRVVGRVRTNAGAATDQILLRVGNGGADSSSIYAYVIRREGSAQATAQSNTDTSFSNVIIPGDTATQGYYGLVDYTIDGYSEGHWKEVCIKGGHTDATNYSVAHGVGTYRSNNVVDTVLLLGLTNPSLISGSYARLYRL